MTTIAFLGPIERVLHALYVWIHETTGLSWAWSIVALTVIVRLVIFPLTAQQTRSSLAMMRLQPYIKQLQQKHKDDRAALNQATLEFYRDNKVNPLASCLPMLIQLPIFLALFFVLRNFSAPAGTADTYAFLGSFINDIRQYVSNSHPNGSIGDNWWASGWILLAIYVLSQLLSTVTMVTSPNPQQKYIFMAMPFVIAPFLRNMPVGVVLYWITTNLWSLAQYKFIVATTDQSKEVVLPADSKGRKKVVGPLASNQKSQKQRQAAPKGPQVQRRNKRRK